MLVSRSGRRKIGQPYITSNKKVRLKSNNRKIFMIDFNLFRIPNPEDQHSILIHIYPLVLKFCE